MNTHFNKRYRHSQLAQPRDQKATLVSRSAYFSRSAGAERETSALTRGAGGKGLGESGTRWGRINSKTRHRDHKKETGGERPSGDSSCFDSRQTSVRWGGTGSADRVTAVRQGTGGNECALCETSSWRDVSLYSAPYRIRVFVLVKKESYKDRILVLLI